MTIHDLKVQACYFDAVVDGRKLFETRLNDRAFQTGDFVRLRRLSEDGKYYDSFKKETIRKITFILQGGQFGIEPRYCVLGLSRDEVTLTEASQ